MNYQTISLTPFLIIVAVLVFIIYLTKYNEDLIKKSVVINRQKFKNPKANWMYLSSYAIPFKWFVEDDDNLTEKGLNINTDLIKSGIDDYFTVRSFMAFKVMLMVMMLVFALLVSTLLSNIGLISELLLNIPVNEPFVASGFTITIPVSIGGKVFDFVPFAIDYTIFGIFLFISLYPNFYVKNKIKKNDALNNKDIPILQIFIILMLKSRKIMTEIIYGLSKIDTPHKKAFEHAYRIYIRNNSEGLDYLIKYFSGNRFAETFVLLEEMGEYAREDTIDILQANLKNIIEDVKLIEQKKAGTKILYSQGSMVIPFTAVILLGALPIVTYGVSKMSLQL